MTLEDGKPGASAMSSWSPGAWLATMRLCGHREVLEDDQEEIVLGRSASALGSPSSSPRGQVRPGAWLATMRLCGHREVLEDDQEEIVLGRSASALGSPSSSPRGQSRRSRIIDAQLKEAEKTEKKVIKILLLGGSGSGKTTIFRQMRILHMEGFPPTDYENYRYIVHSNTVQAINQLLNGCALLNIPLDISIQADVREFHEFTKLYPFGYYELDPNIGALLTRIWLSHAVKKAYQERYRYPLLESAKYYLDELGRISERGYKPTVKDIICCRFQTTGIYEMTFNYRAVTLRMVDVGGQRTERKKWIHVFDSVNLILFVIAVSEYLGPDPDDSSLNALEGALKLFASVTSSEFFTKTSFLLFLNKMDIFQDLLPCQPLRLAFPEFKGQDDDVNAALTFVHEMFRAKMGRGRRLVTHSTTATDTDHIALVFETSMDEIISKNMAISGL